MTSRARLRATSEWAQALPGFQIWRSGHLLRRIGPVLQGIALDGTGGRYYPTAHVHALVTDFPVVSLTLSYRLAYGSIPVESGSQIISRAARELADESPLPLREVPSLAQIVEEYRRSAPGDAASHVPELAMLSAFVARDFLEAQLDFVREQSTGWRALPAVFNTAREWRAGRESWLRRLAVQARDVRALEERVERNVRALGAASIRPVA